MPTPEDADGRFVEAERHLALALASIDAGTITTDAHGQVTAMNTVAERITGWSQAQARGQPYLTVVQREGRPHRPHLTNVVDLMIEDGIAGETRHRIVLIARDDRRIPIELNATLLRSEHGDIRGMRAVFKDMTAADRAEADLRRLAAIVESSTDAIIGKTLDGRITAWNRAAEALFGYTEAQALGRSVGMLIPADRLQEEMDILANIIDGKVVPAFDTIRLAKDGRRLDLSVSISPIRDGTGRIVGGSKIARDISMQKRTMAALRESEARLRFALEVAQIGDWDLDIRTGVVNRSIRHDRIFGFDELQPRWSLETFLAQVHPDDRASVLQSYRESLGGAQDWRTRCRIVWADASVHWIDIHASTRYETGDSHCMLGIVTDVTEQRRAEETRLLSQRLEGENRRIEEANRLKSRFLANMSHELRSPLNAIIGFSDLLHAAGASLPRDKARQFVDHIRTSGRHLLQLINDVLDLSKVESGKFEFFPERVDLGGLVEEIRDVLFTQIQTRRLKVELEVAPAVAAVTTDPSRLKQALFNYLSNAIKFTGEGGRISVRALPQGPASFRIEVEDTGVGIAAADLPRLFVEFQQLDSGYTKHHQGTGLGLALTRRLIEAQGGSVGVSSVPGRGSVFHLTLPLLPQARATPQGIAGAPASDGPRSADDPDAPARDVTPQPVGARRVGGAGPRKKSTRQAAKKGTPG